MGRCFYACAQNSEQNRFFSPFLQFNWTNRKKPLQWVASINRRNTFRTCSGRSLFFFCFPNLCLFRHLFRCRTNETRLLIWVFVIRYLSTKHHYILYSRSEGLMMLERMHLSSLVVALLCIHSLISFTDGRKEYLQLLPNGDPLKVACPTDATGILLWRGPNSHSFPTKPCSSSSIIQMEDREQLLSFTMRNKFW